MSDTPKLTGEQQVQLDKIKVIVKEAIEYQAKSHEGDQFISWVAVGVTPAGNIITSYYVNGAPQLVAATMSQLLHRLLGQMEQQAMVNSFAQQQIKPN